MSRSMTEDFTDEELLAWQEETLPVSRMRQMEAAFRNSPEFVERYRKLQEQLDQGGLTLGEVWRRHRIGCFSKEMLARHARGETSAGLSEQILFHLQTVECVWCQAVFETLNEDDLNRTQRVFQTSLGGLKPKE